MINTNTQEFMDNLFELIGNASLPPCNIRLGLEIALGQVIQLQNQAIKEEKAQQEELNRKEEEQDGEEPRTETDGGLE